MDHPYDGLWQGGPWEQPAPVITPLPAVHIPVRAQARPTLNVQRRPRRWMWPVGLLTLALAFCLLFLFAGRYLSPVVFIPDPSILQEQETSHSTAPPSIPQAAPDTGITLALADAPAQPLSLPQIYEKVLPSLVSIEASSDNQYSSGSGVVMTADGYIITNAHVVAGAQAVHVRLYDNRVFPASLAGFDAGEDLAILKLDVQGLSPAEFGDSNALVCGETVSALGDPLGYRASFTDGIISALDRELVMDDGSKMLLIQTSAAINFGNSGGPLLNRYGQVVGVNTIKIVAKDGSAESLGFAIPSVRVKYVVDRLIAGQDIRTPVFGFTVSTISRPGGGLTLLDVDPASDAYSKGLRKDDILLTANGRPISSTQDIVRLKQALGPGDVVTLTYLRGTQTLSAQVILMDGDALP